MDFFRSRSDVTGALIATRVAKDIPWSTVAEAVGQSKEWTVAACLGQMVFSAEQARSIVKLFGLHETALPWLQIPPAKGTLTGTAPSDPLLPSLRDCQRIWAGDQGIDP